MKPYSDLMGIGASHIYRTFVVSKEQAARITEEYVDLIEAHGGSPGRFSAQRFSDLLIKELARRHEWRDPGCESEMGEGTTKRFGRLQSMDRVE
jgi:hypothetical protein